MEATIRDLGGLLLKAIPTLVLLLFVYLYLRWMFFRPLEKVLAERNAAIEGAQKSAEALRAKADENAAAIEASLRQAREQIYQEQEEARRKLISEQAALLDQARQESRHLVAQARRELQAETTAAKRELAATADTLAEQITRSLLERKVA